MKEVIWLGYQILPNFYHFCLPQVSLVYIAFNLAVKPDVTPTTPPWKTMEMCPRCVSYPTSDPLAAKSLAEKEEHLQSRRRPDQRLSCP